MTCAGVRAPTNRRSQNLLPSQGLEFLTLGASYIWWWLLEWCWTGRPIVAVSPAFSLTNPHPPRNSDAEMPLPVQMQLSCSFVTSMIHTPTSSNVASGSQLPKRSISQSLFQRRHLVATQLPRLVYSPTLSVIYTFPRLHEELEQLNTEQFFFCEGSLSAHSNAPLPPSHQAINSYVVQASDTI